MFEKIGSFIASIGIVIASWFGYAPEPEKVPITQITNLPAQESNYADEEETFGEFNPVGGQTYRLKTSIGTTDTTILLSSFREPITGNNITMTTLNSDIAYATLDPQSSSRKEFISFTGVTQNSDGSATLTGVSRGLSFQYPFTASSTLRQAHPGQSILILSDSPQFFSEYTRKRSDETITGQWTFTTFPITPSTTPASATTTGIVELATGLEAASSTPFGSSGHRLALSTLISTSTATVTGNLVPVTRASGKIDGSFCCDGGTTTIRGFDPVNIGNGIYVASTTGTSTFNVPTGVRKIKVQVVGAGGAGNTGAANGRAGGGGGGGGYAMEYIDVTGTSTIVYYVATGTAQGTGANGEETRFGGGSNIYLRATGGLTAETGANGGDGGTPGCGSGGDLNICGQGGGAGGSDGTNEGDAGIGGSSILGGGGTSSGDANEAGSAGSNYGGGGSGGIDNAGGNGAGGVIIIEW